METQIQAQSNFFKIRSLLLKLNLICISNLQILVLAITSLIAFSSTNSEARPEYAVKHNYVRCQICHASPAGGGVRNINGKLYGGHGVWNKIIDDKDWFEFDFRGAALSAKNAGGQRTGLFVMTTIASVNVPVVQSADTELPTVNFVASHNFGRAGAGLKDSYIIFANPKVKDGPQIWDAFLVGSFLPAFGLNTDEHRTYIRMQTRTTIYDQEAGFMLSGTPFTGLHYDVAISNGLKDGGSPPSSPKNDTPWGVYSNLRFIPFNIPIMFGISNSHLKNNNVVTPARATSGYTVFSLDRLSRGFFKGSLLLEYTEALGWNNSTINPNINYFIPASDSAYLAYIEDKTSESVLGQLNYDLTTSFSLNYKYEHLLPDLQYKGDGFFRTGVGFKWFINSNASLIGRYEKSNATRSGYETDSKIKSNEETLFFFIHLWI